MLFNEKLEVEAYLWRAFGDPTDAVEARKIGIDEELRVVVIGNGRVRHEALVLRMLAPGLVKCSMGSKCMCNGTDCVLQGLEPVLLSSVTALGNQTWFVEAPLLEFTRSSNLSISTKGFLLGAGKIVLDGRLNLQIPFPGRVPLVRALSGIEGRWTRVETNVTEAPLLGVCLQYETVQVRRENLFGVCFLPSSFRRR
jgi:hypothetical protein